MAEITNEQKLYVLLEYKKERTWYEKYQMRMIKFFNPNLIEWYSEAEKWCFNKDQILGDEPDEEQLEKYGGYLGFHKVYPPYTQSSPLFLKKLWEGAPSNPRNWWKNKWVIGLTISILGLIVGLLQLLR